MTDILQCVYCISAVRAMLCNFSIVGHDESEAMTVNDVPVEHVELVLLVRSAMKEGKAE
jgi:hypothetical protein